MKIALLCDSILLQKTLQTYLSSHVVLKKDAHIIICDKLILVDKPLFLVGHSSKSQLRVPFTKRELFLTLEAFYEVILQSNAVVTTHEDIEPHVQRLNRAHDKKIAKLARKIT